MSFRNKSPLLSAGFLLHLYYLGQDSAYATLLLDNRLHPVGSFLLGDTIVLLFR
ncbi:hypothetical protein SAMN05660841_01159 [Sphingobacterium nematocida]|uniref:Uncharacterized protein n=1 Tax=Sphingobacterium nematocida TaxID=1513896 RepID=A0A1T5C6I2_9SPHI|nr:hypothetical protein SAMN05660841_01159 [Sphingobacterium nematocida]